MKRETSSNACSMSVALPDNKKGKWKNKGSDSDNDDKDDDDDEEDSTPKSAMHTSSSIHAQQLQEREEAVTSAAIMAARGGGGGGGGNAVLLVGGQRQAGSSFGEPTSMPSEVFPLVWSLLLEPKRKYNAATDKKGCLDFKSIASFMLVSRGTKQAFDTCNGWSQCLLAVKQEVQAKNELFCTYMDQVDELGTNGLLADADVPICTSLLEKAQSVRGVATRMLTVMNDFLPAASRLAGIYCGTQVPSPAEFQASLRVLNRTANNQLRHSVDFLEGLLEHYRSVQEIARIDALLLDNLQD